MLSLTSLHPNQSTYDTYAILGNNGKVYVDGFDKSGTLAVATGVDQPRTAVNFTTNTAANALFIKQIFQGGYSGNVISVCGLTDAGKIYKLYAGTPAPEDKTTANTLPLFSKVYAALDSPSGSGQDNKVMARSIATGNCIAVSDLLAQIGDRENNDAASVNGQSSNGTGFVSHFSDIAAFITTTTNFTYLWFNCWDPWSK